MTIPKHLKDQLPLAREDTPDDVGWTERDSVKWLTSGHTSMKAHPATPVAYNDDGDPVAWKSPHGALKACAETTHTAALRATQLAGRDLTLDELEHIMSMVIVGHSDIDQLLET